MKLRVDSLTISCFLEAVLLIAVARQYGHLVADGLQADCSVNHEPFSTADAQVGVDKHNVPRRDGGLLRRGHLGR